jgi:hypothetical protein
LESVFLVEPGYALPSTKLGYYSPSILGAYDGCKLILGLTPSAAAAKSVCPGPG